eukprot:TRINITY_DN8917_c0_g1_i3.p1 TRINITY_DN8917_c0_g1~~TRINITY_DN8917_c0_g1_i3.p1  ORF type:complete len:204 (+),score=20.54 TRINITY_DN8917_c0_g1_i3:48-659(+)
MRRPPRSTQGVSSAASDVYKRQYQRRVHGKIMLELNKMTAERNTWNFHWCICLWIIGLGMDAFGFYSLVLPGMETWLRLIALSLMVIYTIFLILVAMTLCGKKEEYEKHLACASIMYLIIKVILIILISLLILLACAIFYQGGEWSEIAIVLVLFTALYLFLILVISYKTIDFLKKLYKIESQFSYRPVLHSKIPISFSPVFL